MKKKSSLTGLLVFLAIVSLSGLFAGIRTGIRSRLFCGGRWRGRRRDGRFIGLGATGHGDQRKQDANKGTEKNLFHTNTVFFRKDSLFHRPKRRECVIYAAFRAKLSLSRRLSY